VCDTLGAANPAQVIVSSYTYGRESIITLTKGYGTGRPTIFGESACLGDKQKRNSQQTKADDNTIQGSSLPPVLSRHNPVHRNANLHHSDLPVKGCDRPLYPSCFLKDLLIVS
jgi:hypothetical protein